MRMKKTITFPELFDGRDVRFQDDHDGMHAYVEAGDCEVRYAVDAAYANALRMAVNSGGEPPLGQLELSPAKIPAAAHVLERHQAGERKRIERTFYRKHRRFRGLPISISWSSATPHTGAPEINRAVAIISVGVGAPLFEWDGTCFTAFDTWERARRCDCPECRAVLEGRPSSFRPGGEL